MTIIYIIIAIIYIVYFLISTSILTEVKIDDMFEINFTKEIMEEIQNLSDLERSKILDKLKKINSEKRKEAKKVFEI